MKIHDRYTVEIHDMNIFGNGFCRIDNIAVFVLGAVNGDLCEIEITDVKSNFSYAVVVNIIKPSDMRITPECVCFEKCGGCTFLHTSPENENNIKYEYVKNTFKKNGINADFEKTVAPVYEKYRNKVVLFYDGKSYGYNEKSSNKVTPHEKCLLNPELFDRIAAFTAANAGSNQRALFIRKTRKDEITVCPIFRKEPNKNVLMSYVSSVVNEFPQILGVFYSVNDDKSFALENCDIKTLYGTGFVTDTLCGLDFCVSAKSFYQINSECASLLCEKVVSLTEAESNDVCADLFCGTGTIGLILAKRSGAQVYGVEIEKSAVADAVRNAALNGLKNISYYEGDAAKFDKKVSVCIVDPPRKGLLPIMTDTLLRLLPEKIVYVSCNPDTLARDLKKLAEKYEISSPVSIFNMFPRTSHVEALVRLTKRF